MKHLNKLNFINFRPNLKPLNHRSHSSELTPSEMLGFTNAEADCR